MRRLLFLLVIGISVLTTSQVFGSESKYLIEDFFHHHGSVMLIIEVDSGKIVGANDAAVDFYGYTYEELLNMHIQNINNLSPQKVQEEREAAALQERNYFLFEHRLKDGRIKYVEVYSYPYRGDDDEELLYSIIHDVTPRVLSEQEAVRSRWIIMGLLSVGIALLILGFYKNNQSKKKLMISNRDMKNLFDNMNEGFALHEIIIDETGEPYDYRFLNVNQSFERITGLTNEVTKGKTVKELLPKTEDYWIKKYGEVALTGMPTRFTNHSRELDKYFYVSVYAPKKGQFVTIFSDVTMERKLELDLVKEKSLLKTTLYSIGDGVISLDANKRVELMNAVAEDLTGWTLEEAKGLTFEKIFNIIHAETKEKVENPVTRVYQTGETVELGDQTLLIKKNGDTLPIEDNVSPIKDSQGKIVGAVIIFRDFTDKKIRHDEILFLSYHDQLTGLYNRRYFEEELSRLDTSRNLPFTIAMVDVNGLKLTNDAFGHLVGDELLKRVAKNLKNVCRADDIVARIGGDEFVILLPKTDYSETDRIVKRIHEAISNEKLEQIVISISVGWETKTKEDQLISNIFIKAEEYMYRKKLTESQSMRNETIKVILNTLNEKNERERIHSERVSQISKKIGEAMNFDYDSIKEIETAGLMHDIGKISIEDHLLNKPERLTDNEYMEIKKHPESSYQILKSVDAYSSLAEQVLSHHERWDGKGYPMGLKGEAIPIVSRIIAVADAYEAMTSDRAYRLAIGHEASIEELKKYAGTQFDADIVRIFIEDVVPNMDLQ
ncbi:conserved exported protein of unknown function [Petrocella atlantisensis]|uniref:Diguanylate cyclase n=1 Tax=Petrocella atlantisensis TaxID=2173034 RepID=A0A3P7RST6_9FIRM|nr:HD domain-containing phosphohydrolase [Petrocella atlantisensis]VDN46052.1 conserved exported protein of unknown function [Petrocella atlantisensis]